MQGFHAWEAFFFHELFQHSIPHHFLLLLHWAFLLSNTSKWKPSIVSSKDKKSHTRIRTTNLGPHFPDYLAMLAIHGYFRYTGLLFLSHSPLRSGDSLAGTRAHKSHLTKRIIWYLVIWKYFGQFWVCSSVSNMYPLIQEFFSAMREWRFLSQRQKKLTSK